MQIVCLCLVDGHGKVRSWAGSSIIIFRMTDTHITWLNSTCNPEGSSYPGAWPPEPNISYPYRNRLGPVVCPFFVRVAWISRRRTASLLFVPSGSADSIVYGQRRMGRSLSRPINKPVSGHHPGTMVARERPEIPEVNIVTCHITTNRRYLPVANNKVTWNNGDNFHYVDGT